MRRQEMRSLYYPEELNLLAVEFKQSRQLLHAMGDENRQHLIIIMLQSGAEGGLRMNDISRLSNLSCSVVSHQLQILKDAGVVCVRQEGTKNYYYLDPDRNTFGRLSKMLSHAQMFVDKLPDRRGEQD